VNRALRVLEDPVRRAEAMFELAGVPVGEENEPAATPAFLVEVLEAREALSEARAIRDVGQVEQVERATVEHVRRLEAELAAGFAKGLGPAALRPLLPLLGELRFRRRMLEEIEAARAAWEDG
jgi:molecular chaperone HscB